MNYQACDHTKGNAAFGNALSPSNCAVPRANGPDTSESTWPQKSQGRIPVDVLLNPIGKIPIKSLLNPVSETTFQNGLQNGWSYELHYERERNPVDSHHFGVHSAMQESFIHSNVSSTMENQATSQPCQMHSASHTTLKSHKRAANTPPTAFYDHCPAEFSTHPHYCQGTQRIHEEVQSGLRSPGLMEPDCETLYYCKLCNFFSFEEVNVKRHEMLEHCDGDSPRFQCIYGCGHVARSRSNREAHEIFCHEAPNYYRINRH